VRTDSVIDQALDSEVVGMPQPSISRAISPTD